MVAILLSKWWPFCCQNGSRLVVKRRAGKKSRLQNLYNLLHIFPFSYEFYFAKPKKHLAKCEVQTAYSYSVPVSEQIALLWLQVPM
jgi:hypothetical protein